MRQLGIKDLDDAIDKMRQQLEDAFNTIRRLKSEGKYTEYYLNYELGVEYADDFKKLYEQNYGITPELYHDTLKFAQKCMCNKYEQDGMSTSMDVEEEPDAWTYDATFDKVVQIYEEQYKEFRKCVEDTRFSLHAVQLACVKLLLEKHTEEEVVKELQYVLAVNEQDACELIEEYRGLANG